MAKRLVLASLLAAAAVLAASAVDTQLTLHNLYPFPVYPLVTPNDDSPAISCDNTDILEGNGRGLVSCPFPPTKWAGHVVARTVCTSLNCETGMGPPETVVQLVVHSPDAEDLATYSVSLVEGFNVGAVRVIGNGGGVVACKGDAGYFKQGCPLTRVNGSDVAPVRQNCLGPRELKVVFCQTTI
ncbi:unnamed protein product [Alopecurus aequalis]